MTFEEFVATLDEKNPFCEALIEEFKSWNIDGPVLFARKGRDLVEVVVEFCKQKKFPLVDKKLGMVFGVPLGLHEVMRAFLWTYHQGKASDALEIRDFDMVAAWYMTDAMGYYISAMEPGYIVTMPNYQQDRFDRDLFLIYKIRDARFT